MRTLYFDTSALAKLVVDEPETTALRAWLEEDDRSVTSQLTRTELVRAVRRADERLTPLAARVLHATHQLAVTADVLDRASLVARVTLRTLDAIHLASALALGDDLDAFVCYDERLADAAHASGLTVVAPA